MYISQTHGARLFVVSCCIVASRVLCYLKVMVCFYTAQYPVSWTTQSAFLFASRQTCSFRHIRGFSGKSFRGRQHYYAQRANTHISTTVYRQVLIYTAEWTEASWIERECPNFETVAKGGFDWPGVGAGQE